MRIRQSISKQYATFVRAKISVSGYLSRAKKYLLLTRILLLSDTHGHMDERILSYVREADEVWHAGDIGSFDVTDQISALKPLRAVHGNIDDTRIQTEFPRDQYFNCEEVSVWMTHIGGYPGRYNQRVREVLTQLRPNIYVCGHSHILKVMPDKKHDLIHMNPGACGRQGLHSVRTMLRFVIHQTEIKNLEVIELGTRGK